MIRSETPTKNKSDSNPPLRSFYDNLKEKGVAPNLPEYDTFASTLQDSDARRSFYDNLSGKDGINLPEYETFQNTLFSDTSKSKDSEQETLETSSSESPQSGDRGKTVSVPLPINKELAKFQQAMDPDSDIQAPRQEEPPEKDKSLSQIPKTFWNVLSKQVPALMESGRAALHSQPRQHRGLPIDPSKTEEEYEQEDIETRQQALKNAMNKMDEFQQAQASSVTTTGDIEDGIDVVNYVGNAIAQAGAQIPISLATGGATSIGQEVGIIYMDQVEKIAKKEGIEPEKVIEQGLDDRASAAAYGVVAGSLDYLGARGAAKMFPYANLKQSLAQRAIGTFNAAKKEGITEAGQSVTEQFGASRGAGDSFLESVLGIDPNEAAEEGLVGFIGGGGIQAGMQAGQSVANQVKEKAQQSPEGLPEGWMIQELNKDPDQEQESQQETNKESQQSPEQEQVQPEQQIDQPIEFELDPEAAPEQQIEQLEQERERLEARKALEGMEGNTTEDIDNALAQIEEREADLQSQMEQELEAEPEVEEEVDARQDQLQEEQTEPSVQEPETFTDHEQDAEMNEKVFQPLSADINKAPHEMTREEFSRLRPSVEGYLYHGSPEGDISELDPYLHTARWREGQGPYATNNRDIALEYAGGRTAKGGRRKSAKEQGRINYIRSTAENAIDMDARMDQDLWDQAAEDFGVDRDVFEGQNFEAFNDIRAQLAIEGYGSESWYMLENWLREEGYDATTHLEGKNRGEPHQVTIFKGDAGLDPQGNPFNSLKAKVVDPSEVHREVVERALEQGKDIPQRVLEEYPDLAQQYTEQTTEQEATPQQINAENPFVTPDEKYEAWFDSEQGSILTRSRNTGNIVDNKSRNREDVVLEFIKQGSPGARSSNDVIQEQMEINEEAGQKAIDRAFAGGSIDPEFALEEVQDPAELVEAIEERGRHRQAQYESDLHTTLIEDHWKGGANADRLTVESARQFGDYGSYGQNIKVQFRNERKRKLGPANQAGSLVHADEIAEIMSNRLGREVTPDEVVESFVEYHNSLTGRGNRQFDDPIADGLANKFHDVTGQKYTPELAQKIIDANVQSIADNQSVDRSAVEESMEEYIDENGNINYNEALQGDDAFADFLTDNQTITQEELQYVNQQIREYQQREGGQQGTAPQERELSQGQPSPEDATRVSQQQGGSSWYNPSEEQYQEAQQRLDEIAAEQGGQLNTGLDPSQLNPEALKHYVTIGAYHINKGARGFAEFSQRMIQELGDRVRPHLQTIYNELRQSGRFNAEELTDPAEAQRIFEEEIASPQEVGLTDQASNNPIYQSFVEDAGDSINLINNQDLNVAVPAAEQAVSAAIDNGVTSYNEFRKWMEDVMQGDPNYKALQDGWENALSDGLNELKLSFNNKEGTVWESAKNWVRDTFYGVTKRFFVYNQRARQVESKMEEIFGPEYFTGENAKYLISWAMDRVTGRAGSMIDKFINPNKRYSMLHKIVRDIGSNPDINAVNFNKIDQLYSDLAEANRQNRPEKARQIEEQIEELAAQDDVHQFLLAKHAIESNDYAQNTKNTEEIAEVEEKIEDLKTKRKDTTDYTKRQELNERIEVQERYLETLTNPLGISTEQANETLQEFEDRGILEDLEQIGQKVWAMNDAMLSMAVENGVVSKDDAKRMRNVYSNYVPAQRKLTDENGNLIGDVVPTKSNAASQPRIRERKGSTRLIGHVLSNTISNMQDMIHYAHRNKAYMNIAASVERETSRGNMSWGRVVDADEVQEFDNSTEFSRPETRTTYDEEGNATEEEVIVDKAIIWNDAELGNAVNEADMSSTRNLPTWVVQGMRAVINLERAVLTSVNPSFLLVNPVRDVQDAAFNVNNRDSFKGAMNVLKNAALPEFEDSGGDRAAWTDRIFAAHRAIMAYEKGEFNKNEMTEAFGELKSEGGTSSFFRFRSNKDIVNKLDTAIKDIRALESEPITSPSKYKALFKKKLEMIELLNEAMENATRLAVYKTIRDQGRSKEEAARLAKEATVNFDMQGTYSPYLKLGYLFLQVGLNAATSMGKGLVKNPKSFMTYATGLTMGGFAISALLDSMEDEDDYYKDKQNKMWKYDSNLVFKIPGVEEHLTIPMGYQGSMFTSLGGHLYDYLQGYSDADEFVKRSSGAAVDVYNPFGGGEMFTDSKYFMRSVAPTQLQPFAEVGLNRSFFGPIYNDFMDSNSDYPDYLLRSTGDRRISKYLSTWLAKHDVADISPKTFDHFVDFLGGGLLRDIESGPGKIVTAFEAAMNDWENPDGTPYKIKGSELPVLRRFVSDAQPTRIAYNNLWTTVNLDKGPIPPDTPEFHNHIKGLAEDYRKVVESDMVPDHMIESLDNAIKQYVQQNDRQNTQQETIKYFRRVGMTGSDSKRDRQAYYRSQNQLDQSYWTWENGQPQFKTSARRKAFTKTMIQKIETKVGDITELDE